MGAQMRIFVVVVITLFAIGSTCFAQATESSEEIRALDRARTAAEQAYLDSLTSGVRNRISAVTSATPVCSPPDILPVAPNSNSESVTFTGSRYDGKFSAVFWRQPCDASTSYLYLRITPTLGAPFICSSAFTMLVEASQYDVKLSQYADGMSFCDELYLPTTFLVEQWSFDRKYDVKKPLVLIYEDGDNPITVSLPAAQSSSPVFIPVGGVWWDPLQSGTGYGIDYKDGVLVVQVYSYLASGAAQWYLAAGQVNGNVFQATLDKYVNGQCISCTAVKRPTLVGNDGVITITFTSATTANVSLPGGRATKIQRYFSP